MEATKAIATQVRITKCYLIEICGKDGKELQSDFSFLTYHESKLLGENMKNKYNERTLSLN